MNPNDSDWSLETEPSKHLNVIVVGAGIAGLTASLALRQIGHHVILLEQSCVISEVGAGIQMAPNNMRILQRLGILPKVLERCNLLNSISLRRWQNNEELGTVPLMPTVAERYDAPLGVIHRGELQKVLLDAAIGAGVELRTGSPVTNVDADFEARIQLANGEWMEGDVLVAADGIKSKIRELITRFHSETSQQTSTGDAAYRLLIPREVLEHDQYSLSLLENNVATRWMGPHGHIMGYPIKGNTMYNMVLVHPEIGLMDADHSESWTRKGNKYEMMGFYQSWCPEVRRLLSLVTDGQVIEWTLNSHPPLGSWSENKTILIGDSSHPMLPYVAQGCAQAMEDAGVLQCALLKSPHDISTALKVFQLMRKERAEKIQASAASTRKSLHLSDGPEQQGRDENIRLAGRGGSNPDLWADRAFQDFMWGTDVMRETIVHWSKWEAMVKAEKL